MIYKYGGTYEFRPDYEEKNVDINNLTTAQSSKDAAEEVYGCIQEKNIEAQQTSSTKEEGTAVFTVESGMYLLAKESTAGEMAPVLLGVPENYSEEYLDISPNIPQNQTNQINRKIQLIWKNCQIRTITKL